MALEDDYPSLTRMLDAHFRRLGDGDAAAVEAFVAEAGEAGRAAVVADLERVLSDLPDPFALRLFLMEHRFDMIPADGAESWLAELLALVERAY